MITHETKRGTEIFVSPTEIQEFCEKARKSFEERGIQFHALKGMTGSPLMANMASGKEDLDIVKSSVDSKKKYLVIGKNANSNTLKEYFKVDKNHSNNTTLGRFAVAAMFDQLPKNHKLREDPDQFYSWYDLGDSDLKIILPWEVFGNAREQIARGEKPFIPYFYEECTAKAGYKFSPYQDIYKLADLVKSHLKEKDKFIPGGNLYYGKPRGGEVIAAAIADQNDGIPIEMLIPYLAERIVAVDDISDKGLGMGAIQEYPDLTFATLNVRKNTQLPPDVVVHDEKETGDAWMIYMNERNHEDYGTTYDKITCTHVIENELPERSK